MKLNSMVFVWLFFASVAREKGRVARFLAGGANGGDDDAEKGHASGPPAGGARRPCWRRCARIPPRPPFIRSTLAN